MGDLPLKQLRPQVPAILPSHQPSLAGSCTSPYRGLPLALSLHFVPKLTPAKQV